MLPINIFPVKFLNEVYLSILPCQKIALYDINTYPSIKCGTTLAGFTNTVDIVFLKQLSNPVCYFQWYGGNIANTDTTL